MTYSKDNNSFYFHKKIQNLCSKSSSECVLPQSLWQRPEIPFRSKVIVKTVTEGHFSTHFQSDLGS